LSQNAVGRALKSGTRQAIALKTGADVTKIAKKSVDAIVPKELKSHLKDKLGSNKLINDDVSLIETAREELIDCKGILGQMQDLARQSSSSFSLDEDSFVDNSSEFAGLRAEFLSKVDSAEYDGKKLFDGSAFEMKHLIGKAKENVEENISISSSAFNLDLSIFGMSDIDLGSQQAAQMGVIQVAQAMEKVEEGFSQLSAFHGRLLMAPSYIVNDAKEKVVKSDKELEATAQKAKELINMSPAKAIISQANTTAKTALRLV
jgi:flagellin-like hook-associated protein FlgL